MVVANDGHSIKHKEKGCWPFEKKYHRRILGLSYIQHVIIKDVVKMTKLHDVIKATTTWTAYGYFVKHPHHVSVSLDLILEAEAKDRQRRGNFTDGLMYPGVC